MTSSKVKAIYTTEMDALEKHFPADPECFCVFVRLMVGPHQEAGEEAFDVKVCNPRWLEKEIQRDGFVLCTHCLIVGEYDPNQIRKILTKLFEGYSGDTWNAVAQKLSRIGNWEFAD